MDKYTPKPIELSDIVLDENLNELLEAIAKNVHETWAQSRLEQGWSYGPERSDALKEHPCLVPYECLAETEKDYDRHTALSTLKLITKLGFTITKNK